VEIENIEDDTGNFQKESDALVKQKVSLLSSNLPEIEKVRLSTSEEMVETQRMQREDIKNELRKLAYNQNLKQETYYLINKQFKKEISLHPPKNVTNKLLIISLKITPRY
jgi:hypothetical protein